MPCPRPARLPGSGRISRPCAYLGHSNHRHRPERVEPFLRSPAKPAARPPASRSTSRGRRGRRQCLAGYPRPAPASNPVLLGRNCQWRRRPGRARGKPADSGAADPPSSSPSSYAGPAREWPPRSEFSAAYAQGGPGAVRGRRGSPPGRHPQARRASSIWPLFQQQLAHESTIRSPQPG